ncbi:hypothetical protein HOY80DRAFT_996332, partial [Tuber brumale]
MKNNMNNILGINQQERINSLIQHENYRYWLGGFVEGEGALVVSIVKNDRLSNGISLQHENGINILYSYKALFENSGNVFQKSGSDKVLVYSLKGTQNIKKYVLPFYSKYVVEYSSKFSSEKLENFCYIIEKLDSNKK